MYKPFEMGDLISKIAAHMEKGGAVPARRAVRIEAKRKGRR